MSPAAGAHPRPPSAVLLAAGASSRMGTRNKLLVDVGGVPMIRRVAEVLLAVPLASRTVVTGHRPADVRAALDGLNVTFVYNPDYAEGIASSIRTGVASLPPDVSGVLVVLGDMPYVTPDDIRRLLRAFEPGHGRGICVPVRAGRRGNPVLWARRYIPELAALHGDTGGRQLFATHADDVAEVPVSGDGVLRDVDTPEALDV